MSELSLVTVTLSTALTPDQLNAILKQNCRSETAATLVAHDPMRIPVLRIYELSFASVEERDRLLIALRMREQGPTTNASRTGVSLLRRA